MLTFLYLLAACQNGTIALDSGSAADGGAADGGADGGSDGGADGGSGDGGADGGAGDGGADGGAGDGGADGGAGDGGAGDGGADGGADGGSGDGGAEAAGDYSTTGPWPPGASSHETSNRDGDTLYVEVWYPAAETGSAHWYGWDSYGFEGAASSEVAPDCAQPRPVMVHSHGYGSIRWEMFWLPELAASHGWITVAADHPGNTFYDGTRSISALVEQRPADVVDTYDWLLVQSADPESPLHGCIDADAGFVATGYSFGGYTAYATGGALVDNRSGSPTHDYSDDRVTAIVTYVPWDANEAITSGSSAVTVPVLTLGGERDDTVGLDYIDLFAPVTSVPRALGSFPDAGHYSFTPIYCAGVGNGCGPGYIGVEEFTALSGTAVLAFTGHLRGLDGAIEQLPEDSTDLSWELVLE